ncbi:malto-oligosyltrehalose synthase [Candidatus Solirubrobacter pratensis]|uniref:malto-oligosyltrehalose synthase n=1 Tax=Candidatus Solirubrobacter pratensis TaxID=1298857 RepID=UPI0004199FBE|nr:malto-oligosyltrehalose synthase [Candidatus Solirubrobacter pratensis]
MTEPRATYRLQLAGDFGFARARELVPYLRDLGVSHVYLPPSFQARTGSAHGYDVVDPNAISEERGGEREFFRLVEAVRDADMGIVLDIVPNHMAVDDANRYWSDRALRAKFFDVDERTGRHRRFFDIDHLAGVRQEDPEVFAATHDLVLRLVREGHIDGLRIDHPDGLADPAGYLERLREGGAGHVWVEKILDPGEHLRDWPVAGTTGYEFLNDVAALYVDPAGEAPLTDLWEDVSNDHRRFGEHAFEAKLEQARTSFAPEVDRLRREAPRALTGLERALASLPVYRTYVEPWSGRVEEADRRAVAEAGLPESLARILTLDTDGWGAFVTRFQQTTPPVMAKGVEDTAFYRYLRLLALNDVGGDPSRFSLSVARFHAANAERAERFPLNLLATQTHDTKRSGDVRARLGALASMPERWAELVRRWLATSRVLTSGGAPDRVEQYLIFQTLVAAWPIEPDRLMAYMEKALREAKRTTNWIEPDDKHEAAVRRFCRALYDHRDFRRDFDGFAAELAEAGDRAALGQLLLKLTVPGVPDIYQGDELLSLSLVDPDNRRPVDWEARRAALDEVAGGATEPRKLWLIHRALGLRACRPDAFGGSYDPLDAGPDAVAFARDGAVVAAARLRGDGAEPVTLPDGRWRDVLGERELSGRLTVADLTGELGIALLERG